MPRPRSTASVVYCTPASVRYTYRLQFARTIRRGAKQPLARFLLKRRREKLQAVYEDAAEWEPVAMTRYGTPGAGRSRPWRLLPDTFYLADTTRLLIILTKRPTRFGPYSLSFRYYGGVEEFLIVAVGYLRLAVEAIGAAVIGIGAAATVFRYALSLLSLRTYTNSDLRLYLGRFLALGLEFQLASDILATAVAPTFEEVQLLAAIVVIRTVLNYFLQKELEREQDLPKPERDAPVS